MITETLIHRAFSINRDKNLRLVIYIGLIDLRRGSTHADLKRLITTPKMFPHQNNKLGWDHEGENWDVLFFKL